MREKGTESSLAAGQGLSTGAGEMGERTRAFDWAKTPVGPVAGWSQSLKTAVQIMLHSRYPMFIWWGEDLTIFYNDAYIPVLGTRHPAALGTPASEAWSEIWSTIGPQTDIVLKQGRSTWNEELLLVMERNRFLEETYFTFSYSPIPDDEGAVGGVFCACTEDTAKVLSERRLRILRELAARTTDEAKSPEDACRTAAHCLQASQHDLPFTLFYLLDRDGRRATLAGLTGLSRDMPTTPAMIELSSNDAPWPFREVVETGRYVEVDDLLERFGQLPGGAWPESPQKAVVLPMAKPGQTQPAGFVVAGISPRLAFNDDYKGFMDLLASHIATAVANAGAYEEEKRRAEGLSELDRAKTTFFSNVSHEFRTPLILMLGPIDESLSDTDDPLTPRQRERLEVAHRNSLRLLKLVNTLLDFSRIEAGRVQASYNATDLASFTGELASNFRAACEKAGLELEVNCTPLPEPVYVDQDMWEKIVLNLVSNAFKFTLHGKIQVEVRAVDQHVELVVRDTGLGIPAEEVPKLFERFHRVRGTNGRTQEGSGIGLALVQELVRLHGGQVRAESELGHGSTFVVTLPFGKNHLPTNRIDVNEVDHVLPTTTVGATPFVEEALRWVPESTRGASDATSAVPLSGSRSLTTSRARFRILLAEDNADMRDYVNRLLSREYEVSTVVDGLAALRSVRQQVPDLILTDVMMPGLDGFGLLREVRADPRTQDLPVLLLSARAGEEARVEGMEAGADDYLTKPFSAKELVARVGTHLALAKLRREAGEALRESEARFRNMADNASVMIWVTEPAGHCSYLNPQWYDFTGTTAQQGLGYGWLDSVHPDDRENSKAAFLAANTNQIAIRIEYRLRRHDGEFRWVIDSAAPRINAGGEFFGYIGSVIDITDLKRVEADLRAADRRKDEFLAMLAHELRNPLAPIRSGLDLLALEPGTQRETISLMQEQLEHLVRLVDDLLDVSRIMRGKIDLRRETVELSVLIKRPVEAVRAMVDQQRQELSVSVPEQPIWLNVDPVRFVQVIQNLLNNASKYTNAGGHVELQVELLSDEVEIRVQDTGIGIEPALVPNVFDLFTQSSRSLDRAQGGLGIGLTLVKSLVEMHNGTVTAHSDGPGQGSTFRIRLPVTKPTVLLDETVKQPGLAHACRVLVVDDNRSAVWLLSKLLAKLGDHQVETAHDGRTALEKLEHFGPQLILLDIGLPGMDGYQVAKAIRQSPQFNDVLLIALTGYGQLEDRRKSHEAGFDEHLVKPPSIEQLKTILGHPKLTRPDRHSTSHGKE